MSKWRNREIAISGILLINVSAVMFLGANTRAVAESCLPGPINGREVELVGGSECWSAHLGVKPLHSSFIKLNESATRRIEIGYQSNGEPDCQRHDDQGYPAASNETQASREGGHCRYAKDQRPR
jgi:hypothetical protein